MPALRPVSQLLNRALRAANDLAVRIASEGALEAQKLELLGRVTSALELLTSVQGALAQLDPDSEFHYDSSRPATGFMLEVKQLIAQAEALAARGSSAEAVACFERARDLEPPPLTYELITKRLQNLRSRGD